MGVEFGAEWDPKALKELRKLDGAVRLQFLRKLEERQSPPRVPSDALHGMKDCYKIKREVQVTGCCIASRISGLSSWLLPSVSESGALCMSRRVSGRQAQKARSVAGSNYESGAI